VVATTLKTLSLLASFEGDIEINSSLPILHVTAENPDLWIGRWQCCSVVPLLGRVALLQRGGGQRAAGSGSSFAMCCLLEGAYSM
jgi:hypothetical protein